MYAWEDWFMSFLFFFYANPFGFINLQCVLLNMSCMADLQTLSKKKAFINAAVKEDVWMYSRNSKYFYLFHFSACLLACVCMCVCMLACILPSRQEWVVKCKWCLVTSGQLSLSGGCRIRPSLGRVLTPVWCGSERVHYFLSSCQP